MLSVDATPWSDRFQFPKDSVNCRSAFNDIHKRVVNVLWTKCCTLISGTIKFKLGKLIIKQVVRGSFHRPTTQNIISKRMWNFEWLNVHAWWCLDNLGPIRKHAIAYVLYPLAVSFGVTTALRKLKCWMIEVLLGVYIHYSAKHADPSVLIRFVL